MTTKEKLRHWFANQAQSLILLGWRKYLKGQIVGLVLGALVVLIPSCVFG